MNKLGRKVLLAPLWLCATALPAASIGEQPPPKELLVQIDRLSDLFRDSYAELDRKSVHVQCVSFYKFDEFCLAAFTLNGYSNSGHYTQFIAAFEADDEPYKKKRFVLKDVMPIGSDNWRIITSLNATIRSCEDGTGNESIDLPVSKIGLEQSPGATTVHLALVSNRFAEMKHHYKCKS